MIYDAEHEPTTEHDEDAEHAEAVAAGARDFDARLNRLARERAAQERGNR